MSRIISALIFVAAFAPLPSSAETMLLMAEEKGCFWCERWNKEISKIYPKTIEGKIAPLKRFDIHDGIQGVTLARSAHFTPTFILVDDGVEVGRIEGYPGEDFFWGLLNKLIDDAKLGLDESS